MLKEKASRIKSKFRKKIKRLRYRLISGNRFIMEGMYKYGNPDSNFFKKALCLFFLECANLSNIQDRRRPFLNEIKGCTHKPCVTAPESTLTKRTSYTRMSKLFLTNDVISFDVFDTLILRPFDSPESVFFLLGEIHKCPGFKRYRVLAEKLARREAMDKTGSNEVTLYDIYRKMQRFVILDIKTAVSVEIETELSLVFANPYMKNVFLQAKNLGKKIIAVSDMYLPCEVIEKMLSKCGYSGFDKIIVSNEYGKSKRSGELYEAVKQYCGENKKILHIGDNITADRTSAERQGIVTEFYRNVNATGNQYRAFEMTSLIGSAYRGIVNAKLQNGDKGYSAFYEYGYAYAGFLALGYCNFIHDYVTSNNIDRILFLSRDGYILKQVYDSLYSDSKTSYVYWSRSAATKLTVKRFRNELLLRYIKYKIPRNMTVKEILTAMDLPQMGEPLEKSGISQDDKLTQNNYEQIASVFMSNWNIVTSAYEESNRAARKYYENILEGCKSACVVDIGWAASGFSALRYLVEDEWRLDCKLNGLVAGTTYLHDMDIIESQLDSGVISSYMFSQRNNPEIRKIHNVRRMYAVFTEIMLSAPQPSFLDFHFDENGEVAYTFDCPEVEGYDMINDIQKGVKDFVSDYTRSFADYPYMMNIPGSDAYAVCRHIISCPEYFKNLFADYPVNRAVGTASFEMGTLSQLIENEFVK